MYLQFVYNVFTILYLIIVGVHLVYYGKIYSQDPLIVRYSGNFCDDVYFIGGRPLLTFYLWRNQVVRFYEEGAWKAHEEKWHFK